MSCCVLSLRRPSLAWAALFLAGSPLWAQGVGSPYPYSGYSFGSTSYPYAGSIPSMYGGAPPSYQGTGTPLRLLTSPLYSPQMFVPGYPSEGRIAMSQPDNRARIWLHVPADAEVWFEGAKTKQTGMLRYYFSPPLSAGRIYSYQVEVRWKRDGKSVKRKQQIDVRAGEKLSLDLSAASTPKKSAIPKAEEPTRPQAGK